MKCLYCGAELPEGSRFCSSCGNSISGNNVRQCPHCGKPAAENELICSACGTSLTGNVTEPARRNYSSPVKKTNKGVIAVIIVAAVIVFAAAVAVGFAYINTSNDDEEKSSEATQTPAVQQTPTASPQQSNVTTALPAGAVSVGSEGQPPAEPTPIPEAKEREAPARQTTPAYTPYSSSKYSFSCSYPTSFRTTIVDDSFILYSCESPDSAADLYINGTENSSGLSPQTVFNNFVSSYGGAVDYRNVGDDFCAGSTINGSRSHYCYYKLTDGMIRGFEFHYPTSQHDYYDRLINEVYATITFY